LVNKDSLLRLACMHDIVSWICRVFGDFESSYGTNALRVCFGFSQRRRPAHVYCARQLSIFIPTALGLVLFSVQHRSELGRNIFINLPNAGFVPLASLILILISYFWCWTSTMLDNIFFDRIHEIEDLLHIEGHHYVLERIKCNTWFKFRRKMWHFILPLFIIAYLVAAIWLFRETVIG
jgi:hypothetical protein